MSLYKMLSTMSLGPVSLADLGDFSKPLFGLPAPGPKPGPGHISRVHQFAQHTRRTPPVETMSTVEGEFSVTVSFAMPDHIYTAFGRGPSKVLARQAAYFRLLQQLSGVEDTSAGKFEFTLAELGDILARMLGPVSYADWAAPRQPIPNWSWYCCMCEEENSRTSPTCDFCGADVSDHVSTGYVPTFCYGNGTTPPCVRISPRFGKKKGRAQFHERVARPVAKAVKEEVKRDAKKEVKALVKRKTTVQLAREVKAHVPRVQRAMQTPGLTVASQQTRAVVQAIALPEESPGVRLPGEWQVMPTAVMSTVSRKAVPFVGPTGGASPGWNFFPPEQAFAALVGNALRSSVVYQADSLGGAYSLWAASQTSGSIVASAIPTQLYALRVDRDELMPFQFAYGTPQDAVAVHGPIWPMAMDNVHSTPGKYMWMQPGDTFQFGWGGGYAPGVYEVTVSAMRWTTGAVVQMAPLTVDASTGVINYSFTAMPAGYYAFSFSVALGTALTYPAQLSSCFAQAIYGASGRFAHSMAPALAPILASLDNVRLIGASLQFMNTINQLELSGALVQKQLPNGATWDELINSTPANAAFPNASDAYGYDAIATMADVDMRRANKGSYMFRLPSTPAWADWTDEFTAVNGVLIDTHYPLSPARATLVWATNIPVAGQNGVFIIHTTLEAQTTDTSRELAKPTGSSLAMVGLQDSLRDIVQYHENPLHVRELVAGARRVARRAGELVQRALPYAALAAKFAATL